MFSAGPKERKQHLAKGGLAPTSTLTLRELWESKVNAALAAAGRRERVDRRSLQARGVHRKPQIHEGPRARTLAERGQLPKSRIRPMRNAVRRSGAPAERSVDYGPIDKGQTRVAYNAARRAEIAAERPRSPDGHASRHHDDLRPRVQAPARPVAASGARSKPRIPLR